ELGILSGLPQSFRLVLVPDEIPGGLVLGGGLLLGLLVGFLVLDILDVDLDILQLGGVGLDLGGLRRLVDLVLVDPGGGRAGSLLGRGLLGGGLLGRSLFSGGPLGRSLFSGRLLCRGLLGGGLLGRRLLRSGLLGGGCARDLGA